jgi:hypothetical protein
MKRMWRIHSSPVAGAVTRWQLLDDGGRAMSFAQAIGGWSSDDSFRTFWLASLRTLEPAAYCWECPPVTAASVSQPFECVFVASPGLARAPADPEAFAGHFRRDREVVTFDNLGRDAVLVAPCPGPPGGDYSHLASFTATAPPAQQGALWQAVGKAMEARVGAKPAWLSTAGHGVAWLHLRLDDRPKYYQYAPYRRA